MENKRSNVNYSLKEKKQDKPWILRVNGVDFVNVAGKTFDDDSDAIVYSAEDEISMLEEAKIAWQYARKKGGVLRPGDVCVIESRKKAKYVFHTMNLRHFVGNTALSTVLVEQCVRNCFVKATELKLTSIAFPLLSIGIYGFPKDIAVDIIVRQALRDQDAPPGSTVKTVKFISTDDICNKQFQQKLTEHNISLSKKEFPNNTHQDNKNQSKGPVSRNKDSEEDKEEIKIDSVVFKSKSCKSCKTGISVSMDLKTTLDYFKCLNCKKVHCAAHGDNLMERCFCFCPKCIGSTTEVSEPSRAKICRKCNVSLCLDCNRMFEGVNQKCRCNKSCEVDIQLCSICLDKKKDTVFLPCKHYSCCYGCAERLRNQRCPICRGNVQDMMKIYPS